MGVGGQHHTPVALPPERPDTHCTGGWVGPRASLEGCGKARPPPEFDPWTVQPVVSRYTDYVIPATRSKGGMPINDKCERTWMWSWPNQCTIPVFACRT